MPSKKALQVKFCTHMHIILIYMLPLSLQTFHPLWAHHLCYLFSSNMAWLLVSCLIMQCSLDWAGKVGSATKAFLPGTGKAFAATPGNGWCMDLSQKRRDALQYWGWCLNQINKVFHHNGKTDLWPPDFWIKKSVLNLLNRGLLARAHLQPLAAQVHSRSTLIVV